MPQIFDVTANENARYKRNELEYEIISKNSFDLTIRSCSGSTALTKTCYHGYGPHCKVTFYVSIRCHFVSVLANSIAVFSLKLQSR